MSHFGRGMGQVLTGRWSEGVDSLQLATTIFREHCQSDNWTRATIHIVELSALALKGHFSILLNRVPELLELAKDRKNEYFASSLRLGYAGLTWLAADDPDTAERHLQEAAGSAYVRDGQLHRYFALVARIHLSLYRDEPEHALQLISAVESGLEDSMVGNLHFVRSDLKSLYICAQLLAGKGRGHQLDHEHLEQVLERMASNDAAWVQAQALFFRGALSGMDGSEQAVPILIASIEALEDTEQYAFAGAARMHLGQVLRRGGRGLGVCWTRVYARTWDRNPERMQKIYTPDARNIHHV